MCMVLLYGVQGDVADVAGVAALQACEENPVLINPWLRLRRTVRPREAQGCTRRETLLCLGYRLFRVKRAARKYK